MVIEELRTVEIVRGSEAIVGTVKGGLLEAAAAIEDIEAEVTVDIGREAVIDVIRAAVDAIENLTGREIATVEEGRRAMVVSHLRLVAVAAAVGHHLVHLQIGEAELKIIGVIPKRETPELVVEVYLP